MALKINKLVIPTSLLICLIILSSAYWSAGVYLFWLKQNGWELWLYGCLLALCASVWTICQNLGGILGALSIVLASWFRLEWTMAGATTVFAVLMAWFGLQSADPVVDRSLKWYEWLGGLLMGGCGVVFALAILRDVNEYKFFISWLTPFWLGLVGYSLITTGSQLQIAEIPERVSLRILMGLLTLGVGGGWLYGTFHIPVPRFSWYF